MKKAKIINTIVAIIVFLAGSAPRAYADSLDVVDADVRQVLTGIAAAGKLNLVLDSSVQGSVSLKLDDLPPAEMVRIISRSSGFDCVFIDGIIYVRGGQSGRVLQSVRVNYIDLDRAADMAELLLEGNAGRIDKADKEDELDDPSDSDKIVVVNRDDNTLTFWASPQKGDDIRAFLQSLDRAPRQVSLEAKVTAVQKDAAADLGVSWEWSKLPQSPEHDVSYDVVRHTVRNEDGSFSEVSDYIPVDEVTRSWDGGNVPGVIRFGRGPEGYPYEFYYAAQLHALISDGKASVLARPNITTIQGNEAVINIGSEVPVPTISTTDSTTTTSIQYREAGIILKCTPRVNEDGIITVRVHTEVSSPLYVEDMKAYRFQKRSADTIVRLKDGETMVIGGLIGSDEARQMSKIPFLGDIPILGNLFKHIKKSKSDSEVMIFLTAREVK